MKTATGSTAAKKGWTAERKDFNKSWDAECVERSDHAKRDGENARGSINASRSMKVMSVNLKGQFRYIMWCDKPSVMNFRNSNEVNQEKCYISSGSTLGESARRNKPWIPYKRRTTDLWSHVSCNKLFRKYKDENWVDKKTWYGTRISSRRRSSRTWLVRLPRIRAVTRCATNLEECVNHEWSGWNTFSRLEVKHVKVAQVVLENREVIDQLWDDQMNHVSSAKRVYWMLQDVEEAACRLQSQPLAQEKSKPAARARSEFNQRSDASETVPISSTADAVRWNQQSIVSASGEPQVGRSFSQDRQSHSRVHVEEGCERTQYKTYWRHNPQTVYAHHNTRTSTARVGALRPMPYCLGIGSTRVGPGRTPTVHPCWLRSGGRGWHDHARTQATRDARHAVRTPSVLFTRTWLWNKGGEHRDGWQPNSLVADQAHPQPVSVRVTTTWQWSYVADQPQRGIGATMRESPEQKKKQKFEEK